MAWSSGASIFDLMGDISTRHDEFDFLCTLAIVQHPICSSSIDSNDAMFTGFNHGSLAHKMGCVHHHGVACCIRNGPASQVNGNLSNVGNFDPLSTRPCCIVIGPVRVWHDFSNTHFTLHKSWPSKATSRIRSPWCIGIRVDVIICRQTPWDFTHITTGLSSRNGVN